MVNVVCDISLSLVPVGNVQFTTTRPQCLGGRRRGPSLRARGEECYGPLCKVGLPRVR